VSIEFSAIKIPHAVTMPFIWARRFKLTNILRDVKNDAARGRIYLPQSELEKFRVGEAEILAGKYSDRYFTLATNAPECAKHFYSLAQKTLPPEDRNPWSPPSSWVPSIGSCCKSWSAGDLTSSDRSR